VSLISDVLDMSKIDTGKTELDVQREACIGNDIIKIEVRDTAIGMSAEQIEKVFEPFFEGENTRSRDHSGTGLELTISREFCRLMGGDIAVASELGQGTEFTVRLPAKISAPHAKIAAASGANSLRLGSNPQLNRYRVSSFCR